jgi:hypothetical protein
MGFGAFGKEARLHGGGFWDKLKGFGQKILSGAGKVLDVARPLVGTVAGVADVIKPGLGGAINTGFGIADGIVGSLKGGENRGPRGAPIDSNRLARFNSKFKPTFKSNGKVDSILNNRISAPRKVETYDSEEDESNDSDEIDEIDE